MTENYQCEQEFLQQYGGRILAAKGRGFTAIEWMPIHASTIKTLAVSSIITNMVPQPSGGWAENVSLADRERNIFIGSLSVSCGVDWTSGTFQVQVRQRFGIDDLTQRQAFVLYREFPIATLGSRFVHLPFTAFDCLLTDNADLAAGVGNLVVSALFDGWRGTLK